MNIDPSEDTPSQTRRPLWRRWPVLAGVGALLGVLAVVAFGFFGIHKLFLDDVVNEAGPVFESGASADGSDTGTTAERSDTGGSAAEATESGEPEIVSLATGMFEGRGRYSGRGTAVVITDGTDQRFVRLEEDFATDNGPDLFVYLGTGSEDYGDPGQYLQLGVLSGNIGSQNYEIPAAHPDTGEPIDLEVFDHVAVWCKRFDATFAVAVLG